MSERAIPGREATSSTCSPRTLAQFRRAGAAERDELWFSVATKLLQPVAAGHLAKQWEALRARVTNREKRSEALIDLINKLAPEATMKLFWKRVGMLVDQKQLSTATSIA